MAHSTAQINEKTITWWTEVRSEKNETAYQLIPIL